MTDTTEKKAVRFVDVPGKSRTQTIPLDWPLEFDGKTYEAVEICRSTIGAWRAYFEALDAGERIAMPCFADPLEVMDSLDADDDEKVQAAVELFFPKRFRAKPPEE